MPNASQQKAYDSKRMICYAAIAQANERRKQLYADYLNEIKRIKELEAELIKLNTENNGTRSFVSKQLRCSICSSFSIPTNKVMLTRNGPKCFSCRTRRDNNEELTRSLRDKAYDDIVDSLDKGQASPVEDNLS